MTADTLSGGDTMPSITLRGITREQLVAGIGRAVRCLTGRESDPTGAIRGVQISMAVSLLGAIQTNFLVQSQGGAGDLGTGPWAPLSPVTLALRTKNTSAKVVARLKATFNTLTPARQRQIQRQYQVLLEVYRDDTGRPSSAARTRRHALSLLERMRANITLSRYKALRSELAKPQKDARARRLAFAGAHAEILRDRGDLFNSLSPGLRGTGDQVLRAEPGAIVVGTNSRVAKYHNSPRPRKQKRDGSGPRLPRRQFLPDDAKPVPPGWYKAMVTAFHQAVTSEVFWRTFLQSRG